jgi:hypothetical protein
MALRTFGAAALTSSLVLAAGLALAACAPNPSRLPNPDRSFYYVMEDPATQREFLELKESERKSLLERVGLWQRWLELSNQEREAVENKTIQVGFREFSAHMAWGLPASARQVESRGRVVEYQTFIRCTSGPKIGQYVRVNIDCDGTSSEVEIAVENGVITELKFLD